MEKEPIFLYDEKEDTQTRYVCFLGEQRRFDLAITETAHFYGKRLVMDIQSSRFAIIGQDDISEPGYIEHAFQLTEEEAEELRHFLLQLH